jgi:serine/threonine/tyrosine-interacting protein
MNGISAQLQALDDAVPNKVEWKYEMRREAQEILPGELISLPHP